MIEFDGTCHEVELASAAENATLADLIEHACVLAIPSDAMLWVDGRRHDERDAVNRVVMLQGSRIAPAFFERPQPITGWAASLSGGLEAGLTVPVRSDRPLVIGRSPQADIVVNSSTASWSQATVEHVGERLLMRDSGSTNGTLVDGNEIGEEGFPLENQCVLLVGGSTISLWRGSDEALAPAPEPCTT